MHIKGRIGKLVWEHSVDAVLIFSIIGSWLAAKGLDYFLDIKNELMFPVLLAGFLVIGLWGLLFAALAIRAIKEFRQKN